MRFSTLKFRIECLILAQSTLYKCISHLLKYFLILLRVYQSHSKMDHLKISIMHLIAKLPTSFYSNTC